MVIMGFLGVVLCGVTIIISGEYRGGRPGGHGRGDRVGLDWWIGWERVLEKWEVREDLGRAWG